MKHSYLVNLALVIIIVITYILVNNDEKSHPEIQRLSELNAAEISSITVKRQDRQAIKLLKKENEWVIQSPLKAQANKVRVNLILNLLSSRSYSQFSPPANSSLHQFELDPATIFLQLNQHQFEFGAIEALSQRRYVLYNGSIHLIDDTLMPLLNSTAESFIDNRLLDPKLSIKQLSLPDTLIPSSNSSLTITLKDGHWQSNNSEYTNDTLSAVIQAWQNAYAMQVIAMSSEALQNIAGDKVVIRFKQHETTTFIVESTPTSLFISNLDTQLKYQFPIALKTHLFPSKESN